MEKKHRCRLCFRNFANGKALGGHMRSHMIKFYAEARAPNQVEEEEYVFDHDFHSLHSYSSLLSSSSDEEEEEEEEKRETESSLKDHHSPICRRSKRVRESPISDMDAFNVAKRTMLDHDQSSPVSSISDTTPEEHVAHCLIMLSKDKWEKEEREYEREWKKLGEDREISGDNSEVVRKKKVRGTGKYRCEECKKVFRSYQALGGHRSSHKKIKADDAEAKIYKCPFCYRVFASGQGLGGHKRSHFIGAGATSTLNNQNTSRISQTLNIDLNLPAPLDDDDDDDDASQIAVSALSDAEFPHTINQ